MLIIMAPLLVLPSSDNFGACKSGKATVCFLPPPFRRVMSAREGDFEPIPKDSDETLGLLPGLLPGLLVLAKWADDRRRGEAVGEAAKNVRPPGEGCSARLPGLEWVK